MTTAVASSTGFAGCLFSRHVDVGSVAPPAATERPFDVNLGDATPEIRGDHRTCSLGLEDVAAAAALVEGAG